VLTPSLSAQRTSRDNYTGAWEMSASWDPFWENPQKTISGYDITINGYITLSQSLTFLNVSSCLIVNDTLVINGDLLLGNNNDIRVNDNGILIIRGNLIIDNQTVISTDGYIVVVGDIIKNGSTNQGAFTSNDDPVKVFIGGIISDPRLTNNPDYPVLNMVAPPTVPYPNSSYAFGNLVDLANDQLFSFFQNTCRHIKATSNSPVCEGSTISLFVSGGKGYTWHGPENFSSDLQNPSIINAGSSTEGTYTVTIKAALGCIDAVDTTYVKITKLPHVSILSSNHPMCTNDLRTLEGSPGGGDFLIYDGPGSISNNVLSSTEQGIIKIIYNYTGECANKDTQSIIVNRYPDARAGPDQKLKFLYETHMEAEISPGETGEWSLISGSGMIRDVYSPTSEITSLAIGENIFSWRVLNGSCEQTDDVIITVEDLFVPSVITPDGDGKNDYFKISEYPGHVGLIIFNRWGIEEYRDGNYKNDWDGRNNKGAILPYDTYFYVLSFENGKIKKGSVLIKR
jgi:gliding motility-associated-like protein